MAGVSGATFVHLAGAIAVPLTETRAAKLTQRFLGGLILAQAGGLLSSAKLVFFVGSTTRVTVLLVSQVAFGLGNGLCEAGSFAAFPTDSSGFSKRDRLRFRTAAEADAVFARALAVEETLIRCGKQGALVPGVVWKGSQTKRRGYPDV